MPKFCTERQVRHSAAQMFALVADIERYPEFLPMCESLTIRSRNKKGDNTLIIADMSVGYKMVKECFTSQVYLQPEAHRIDVQYIDGPFKYLENRWQFLPAGADGKALSLDAAKSQKSAENNEREESQNSESNSCLINFYIDYAFKNPMLSVLMGAMFDIAFRKFTQAFETRADKIYGADK